MAWAGSLISTFFVAASIDLDRPTEFGARNARPIHSSFARPSSVDVGRRRAASSLLAHLSSLVRRSVVVFCRFADLTLRHPIPRPCARRALLGHAERVRSVQTMRSGRRLTVETNHPPLAHPRPNTQSHGAGRAAPPRDLRPLRRPGSGALKERGNGTAALHLDPALVSDPRRTGRPFGSRLKPPRWSPAVHSPPPPIRGTGEGPYVFFHIRFRTLLTHTVLQPYIPDGRPRPSDR